jgi:CRP/FNR family cyclic AMP-dependent transcriptional regulator
MGIKAIKFKHESHDIHNLLLRFSLFTDFQNAPEALDQLEKIFHPCEFKPGEEIIKEGTIGTQLFLLVSGKVAVFKKTPSGDEYKVADMSEEMNIFFGEGAILDNDNRSATIRSLSHCQCLSLDRSDFELFSKAHPELALPVFRQIARVTMARLRKTDEDFSLIYNALVSEIRGK